MAPEPVNLESLLRLDWPPEEWRDVHVLIGVSGGADSVALLRAMSTAKQSAGGAGRLFVAHLNHALRADAAEDAVTLAKLCQSLEVPLEIGAADVKAVAAEQGDGLEAAARTARYDFLLETAEKLGARFVAVAHTADDQVETVLHRILRGTAIAGLAGIPRVRSLSCTATLVRPLLGVTREQVLDYLQRIGQDFRVDPTNEDTRFTRNRLRNQLLPLLRSEYNADVDAALTRLASQADECQQLLTALAGDLLRAAATVADGKVDIDCRPLAGRPPILVRETCKLAWSAAGWPLQDMGFDQWQQLAALASGSASKNLNLPGDIRATRTGNGVEISQNL